MFQPNAFQVNAFQIVAGTPQAAVVARDPGDWIDDVGRKKKPNKKAESLEALRRAVQRDDVDLETLIKLGAI